MKLFRLFSLLLALLLAVALTHASIGSPFSPTPALADDDEDDEDDDDDDDDDDRPRRRPLPEFVVSVPDDAALQRITRLGFRIVARERLELTGTETARLRATRPVTLAQARATVARVVPQAVLDLNTRYRPNDFPCSPGDCAAHQAVGFAPASACGATPRIGMIDTAPDPRSPALAGARLDILTTRGAGRPPASRAHGTAVAALIAGAPEGPAPGLLPRAELVAVDAFHRAGNEDVADAYDIVRALDRLAARDVTVVNLSFAGVANRVTEQAVTAILARGIILVAAAGNAGPRAAPLFPAAYPGVIAVTAVDSRERLYRQATGGPHITFAAPGVRLWTASGKSGRLRSGTSYAAPFVTAAIATARQSNPEAPPDAQLAMLTNAARDLGAPGLDAMFGWGLVRMPDCPAKIAY